MISTWSTRTGPTPRLCSGSHGVGPVIGRRSRCTRGTASAGSIRSPSWNSMTCFLRRNSLRRFVVSLIELASSTIGAVTGSLRNGAAISLPSTASSGVIVTVPSGATSRTSTSSTSSRPGWSASSGIRIVQWRPWPRVARPIPSRCTWPAPGPDEMRTSTRPCGSCATLGGRLAQPQDDPVPHRALVDALLGFEELLTEVEVEGTGQRRYAGRPGQRHHIGQRGLGVAGQRGGEVAHPRLGGVAQHDVVLGGRGAAGTTVCLGAVRTRLDGQQQAHATEGRAIRRNSPRNMTVGG